MNGNKQSIEYLTINDLHIDEYQRDVSMFRSKSMASAFDPRLFGVVRVGEREDGTRFIIDGHHRVQAIREMGDTTFKIPCLIERGTTQQEEAEIFFRIDQGTRRLSAIDSFRARYVAKDPIVMGIVALAEKAGTEINWYGGGNHSGIVAVGTCEKIAVFLGLATLGRVFDICTLAWGTESDSYRAEVLQGLALVIDRDSEKLDEERLIQKLSVVRPAVLTGKRQLLTMKGARNLGTTMAEVIVQLYNQDGRRTLNHFDLTQKRGIMPVGSPDTTIRGGPHTATKSRSHNASPEHMAKMQAARRAKAAERRAAKAQEQTA